MMIVSCPSCGDQARTKVSSMSTCVFYPDIYDGEGRLISKDRNTTMVVWKCNRCGEIYEEVERGN